MGLRLSGAAWYDALYNRANDNDSPATVNAFTVPSNAFTDATRNAENIDPATGRGAWGLSLIFTPSYFQVLPNLDLNVPLSLSYNVKGKSPVASAFSGDKAGTFSIGINAEYERTWNANIQYAVYFGGAAAQPLSDRNFISLSIQRTF